MIQWVTVAPDFLHLKNKWKGFGQASLCKNIMSGDLNHLSSWQWEIINDNERISVQFGQLLFAF